jgi:lysophospholipase L1-like esterase
MLNDHIDMIRNEIERAFALAEAGRAHSSLQSFVLARNMITELADQKALQNVIARDIAGCKRERESFRQMLIGTSGNADTLVIFGDSLGLPRPDEKVGPTLGGASTYPWLISAAQPTRKIDSICQRYFTTEGILTALQAEPLLGEQSDILIHVGLNDCSKRMFLHGQRLSMNLLPEDLRARIVGFSQKYRARIITNLPPSHYVPPDAFRTNLDRIVATLKSRKARKVVLATIILPPSKFWNGTPNMNFNFAAYNHDIMTAAHRHKVLLLDMDRYVWQDLPSAPLLGDGMHLSLLGHKLMAERAVELLGVKSA